MKRLIVNADDFGYSKGINEGIIKAYKEGIVTSTSLMVNGQVALQAVELSKKNPKLGLGLHFQVEDYDSLIKWVAKRISASVALEKTKLEFLSQVEKYKKLTGKLPDHIDGHHDIQKALRIGGFIKKWGRQNNIPVRGEVNFIGSFLGMPFESKISVSSLEEILSSLREGTSELMCHPGIVTPDLKSSYNTQREIEVATLTSPEIKRSIKKLNIELISW